MRNISRIISVNRISLSTFNKLGRAFRLVSSTQKPEEIDYRHLLIEALKEQHHKDSPKATKTTPKCSQYVTKKVTNQPSYSKGVIPLTRCVTCGKLLEFCTHNRSK